MSWQKIAESIDAQATAFEEFKNTNDARIEAIEKGDTVKAGELNEKLGRIEVDLKKFAELKMELGTEMEYQRDRIEELESRSKSPGKTAEDKLKDEYNDAFENWIRNKGQSPNDEQRLQDLSRKAIEMKAVSIATGAAGGFAVPEQIGTEIARLEKKFSPVRDLVKVVAVGTSDYKELVNIRGGSSGWVGEAGTRSETNTPQLREAAPTFGELYAYPQASEWSLDDVFFNVEQWLAEEVAQEFALQEGSAVISGDGTSKPTGMVNSAPTEVADFNSPLRAAAVYEFIASLGDDSPVVAEVQADSLISLVYKLNSMYRANGTFVMNSNTTAAVRKLKDTQNQYLWQPGLAGGEPDRLLGYDHRTWEQLDDIGTNNLPIAFGDFRKGYVLADRVGLRITRDNVTNVGFVRFYIRRREGGTVLNNDAIKWIKTTIA